MGTAGNSVSLFSLSKPIFFWWGWACDKPISDSRHSCHMPYEYIMSDVDRERTGFVSLVVVKKH